MNRAIQVYALTICFFTMTCFAITTGSALWNVIKITYPSLTLSHLEYTAHRSDEAYLEYLSNKYRDKISNKQYVLPSSDMVSGIRERAYVELIAISRHDALSDFLFCLVIIIVDLVIYGFHWRIVNRSKTA